jgi:transcription elongation GreA/GreB family factor
MNPEAVRSVLSRKPELKVHQDKLSAMEPGAYVIHRSWGFGQIASFDELDGKLVINFEGKPAHRMDPAFCATTLEILPPNHLLVRRQTEPEVINKLINEKPSELIYQMLLSCKDHAATGPEIESQLSRLLGEDKFKRWWSAAKKAMARDPRIGIPANKNEVYYAREEALSPEADLVSQFKETKSARRRLQLASELVKLANTSDEVREALTSILDGVASAVRDSNQLTMVEKLEGAWIRDDLANLVGEDPSQFSPSAVSLVEDTRSHADLAEKLPATVQARLLGLIKEAHPDQWRELITSLLKTSSGKFTAECINFLVENECEDELSATFKRWQQEQNLRAPVLLWIVKNRASRKYRKLLEGLIGPRLLASIFFAVDYEALQSAGTRRIQLAEYLSDDQDLIPELLANAETEVALDLANQLLMNQGFEELTKKSLLARFIKHYPQVQTLISGESEQSGSALFVSRESYVMRQAELDDIISKKIPENSRAIAAAREHGDLRENSEYKMAKQDQSVLMARKMQLETDLARAQITDFTNAPTDVIGIGNIVSLSADGVKSRYTILGAWDSDPSRHIISYKTALGSALLGKRVGDSVRIREGATERDYVVEAIARYVDNPAN